MKISTLSIAILLVALFNSQISKAQFITIPDPNFVNWLSSQGYAPCINGLNIDTTCMDIGLITSIHCNNAYISDLEGIQYFYNLEDLVCSGNQLTTLPTLPSTLVSLDCSYNLINNIPALPNGISEFHCYNNELTSLPALPGSLTIFSCGNNQLSTIPALPGSVIYLECSNNLITSLPGLPNSMTELYCGFNMLSTLPALPLSLNKFYCQNNQLTALPSLPPSLKTLICSNNLLTSLPAFPANFDFLDCNLNSIVTLPNIPATVSYIICSNNQITSIPNISDSLKYLYCENNQLTSLPPLSNVLITLRCNNNLLTSLPALPNSILNLEATENLLTSIPDLPDSMNTLYINNNSGLTCLPQLHTINNFSFYSTALQCLPNYGTINASVPLLSSLPLCDAFNSNGCSFYYNISGHVFSDSDLNCNYDPFENSISRLKINLYQGASLVQQYYTSSLGLYTMDTEVGTFDYSVDTTEVPFEVLCPASGTLQSILTPADSIDMNMDFGLKCKLQPDLGAFAVMPVSGTLRPGNTGVIRVVAGDNGQNYNLNCANGISGVVTITFSGPVQYSGNEPGSLVPNVTPNTLTYNVVDFGQINNFSSFVFSLSTNTTAQQNDLVCIDVNVTLLPGDLNPLNNNYTHCFTISNSFDPNFKEVSPVNDISNNVEWLTYTIHFQNTGTAPAQHIVLTDTLDANLQESTFTYLGSSHDPIVQVIGNVAKFSFPNINLPDSTSDEPNSHGFVQYKVKIDQALAVGQTIENKAAIYFDFNPPVITNTTVNTIVAPTGISELSNNFFAVYPNPSSEKITVRSTSSGNHNLILTDVAGRIVYKNEFTGNEFNFNVNEFASGMYFLNLESGGKSEVLKVVVR